MRIYRRKYIYLLVFVIVLSFFNAVQATDMGYLNNGVLTIGIDLDKGGTITYLKENSDGRDIVNDYDLGREIQQSYYSGPVPFDGAYWSGNDWPWNPVAAGGKCGYTSTVLNYSNDGQTIYVKRIPKQWGLCNIDSECTMEEWITLYDNVVIMRCRLNNARSDTTFYIARPQELPAVYTNTDFRYLYSYNGNSPWTSDTLSYISNPSGNAPPWNQIQATENWAALVDSSGFGLGVYTPYVFLINGGFHDNAYNPADTGHISPVRAEHLDHNIVYEYESYLIVDDLIGIRDWVYQHRPDPLPNYVFAKNRQSWWYHNVDDTGFPINDYIRVNLDVADPIMISDYTLWDTAEVPKLYVKARYNLSPSTGQFALFFWHVKDGSNFSGATSAAFVINNDNQWHVYEIDLAADPDYTGKIWRLRFDPVPSGAAGDYVDIEYISAYPMPGDFNRDKMVDAVDFGIMAKNWSSFLPERFIGDLDQDRDVDVDDLEIFARYWLETTP